MRLILPLLRTAYGLLIINSPGHTTWSQQWFARTLEGWVRCTSLTSPDGCGDRLWPGHLQMDLQAEGFSVFGVDESRQMARQAWHRSQKRGHPGLTRGYAQHLPFATKYLTVLCPPSPRSSSLNLRPARYLAVLLPEAGW